MQGHFTVQMPFAWGERSATMDDANVGRLVMHFMVGQNADGFLLGVIELERTSRTKDVDPRTFLEQNLTLDISVVRTVRVWKQRDLDLAEARWAGPRPAFVRAIRSPGSMFMLTCEFQPAYQIQAETLCPAFLESFRERR